MTPHTQGASVLDRHLVSKDPSLDYSRSEGIWNYRMPLKTEGSPNNMQLAGPSNGIAPIADEIAQLFQRVNENAQSKFQGLAYDWKRDTGHMSTVSRIVAHPSYLGIIAMGESAIPLILKDLAMEPNHWFSALSAIAGERPNIPEHDRGDIKRIAQAWLEWGKSKKYIE